jgi:hypothetical protein
MKIQENIWEKSRSQTGWSMPTWLISGLSPRYFPVFSPDAKHPVWRPKAAVPESDNVAGMFGSQLNATAGTKFSRHIKSIPLLQVQGIIPWSGSGADSPSVTPANFNL